MALFCKYTQNFCYENRQLESTEINYNITNEPAFPPKSINYDIFNLNEKDKSKLGSTIKKIQFLHKEFTNEIIYPWIKTESYSILKTLNKNKIVVLRIINSYNNDEDKPTILFSHDKSSDLSTVFSFMIDMSTLLKVIGSSYFFSQSFKFFFE